MIKKYMTLDILAKYDELIKSMIVDGDSKILNDANSYTASKIKDVTDGNVTVASDLDNHINDKNNPHEVTLEQLGYSVSTDSEIDEMLFSLGLIEKVISCAIDKDGNILIDKEGNVLIFKEESEV